MSPASILAPVFALAALTAVVWLTMLVQRAQHMQRHQLKPQDMPTRVMADAKFGDAQAANNALMNLFELPVLFYVLSLALIVVDRADAIFMVAGWMYVSLRAVQAVIHVSYNNVLHRGVAYLLSSALLWLMWLRLGWLVHVGS
jgi:hypothetical protein